MSDSERDSIQNAATATEHSGHVLSVRAFAAWHPVAGFGPINEIALREQVDHAQTDVNLAGRYSKRTLVLMPAVIYLSDSEARRFLRVESDKDCDELLQQMNTVTGRTWLIQVQRWFEPRGLFRHAVERKNYTLYLDCHGEYQVMSLVAPGGSSIFHASQNSRESVMNYMLGYLGGMERPANAETRRTESAG